MYAAIFDSFYVSDYKLMMLFDYIFIIGLHLWYVLGNQETDTEQLYESRSCKTPDNQLGACINLKSCPFLLQLLQNRGHERLIATYLRRSQCEGKDMFCCPSRNTSTTILPPSTTPTTASSTPISESSYGTKKPMDYSQCGKSDIKNSERIVGGRNATLGAWPWMVALGYRNTITNESPLFRCGGSLISNIWVVTAAHCLSNIGNMKLTIVRVGDLNLNDSADDEASPIDVQVDQFILHPEYSTSTTANDVALIRLKNPVTFTKFIRRICVIKNEPQYISNEFYTGKRPFVIGWGATVYGAPMTNSLQETQVTIVDTKECARNYTALNSSPVIDHRTLCAGKNGKDSCSGDSGGPLMITIGSTFYLAGIVSFGRKCAEANYPGVYTKVAQFSDWITQTAGL